MRALTIHGTREIRHETVADPAIEAPKDAIVRVRLAGLLRAAVVPAVIVFAMFMLFR